MSNDKRLSPEGIDQAMAMVTGMAHALSLRQSHALYAAHALQGLIAANFRPGAMVDGSAIVNDAWRFADAMLAAQQAREAASADGEPETSSLASVLTRGSA